jgi:acyl-CoA dehydrogenase
MPEPTRSDLVERVGAIARDVAAAAADDVDAAARFPIETFDALRAAGLLSVLLPESLGGEGATLADVAPAVTELGRACASSGMVYAMHLIQLACLTRHASSPALATFARRVADEQLLLASATTEAGVGGDVRTSLCAVTTEDDRYRLEKQASVISYGEQADAVFTTARRTPDSPASDQVLVVCTDPGLSLEANGDWDTLGFRGTCSLGFLLVSTGDAELVFEAPYSDISSHTMLPTSHLLWTSVWLGIATEATDRARRFVQAAARKTPGVTPPSALRLAELVAVLQQLTELVGGGLRRYGEIADDPDATSSMGFAVAMNTLKVTAALLVVEIVGKALLICGIAGYRQGSPFSMGRLLRDAYGAAVMVNNDRINANSAQLLLIQREL